MNTLTVVPESPGPWLATKRLPWASKARALGPFTPVRVALGVVLPGANTLTVVPPPLATKRLPAASKARASGPVSPVRVALAVVLPGANTLTVPSNTSLAT